MLARNQYQLIGTEYLQLEMKRFLSGAAHLSGVHQVESAQAQITSSGIWMVAGTGNLNSRNHSEQSPRTPLIEKLTCQR